MAIKSQSHKILSALNAHLADNNPRGLPVAWHNRDHIPVSGQPWLRASYLPAGSEIAELGKQGRNRYTGIYQVSVFCPSGDGHGLSFDIAGEVEYAFRRGEVLTIDGLNVQIRQATHGQPMQEDNGWFHVPVSVSWFAFVKNEV